MRLLRSTKQLFGSKDEALYLTVAHYDNGETVVTVTREDGEVLQEASYEPPIAKFIAECILGFFDEASTG